MKIPRGISITMWLLIALITCGYMLPTAIAECRAHRNTSGVFIVNLLLGWTLVGWVVALVWACWNERAPAAGYEYQEPGERVPTYMRERR